MKGKKAFSESAHHAVETDSLFSSQLVRPSAVTRVTDEAGTNRNDNNTAGDDVIGHGNK